MIRCPRCNNELPDGVSFCDACGAPVRGILPPASPVYQPYGGQAAAPPPAAMGQGATVCPVCGAPVIPGEAFCDNCGAGLLGPGVAPAVPGPGPVAAPPVGPSAGPLAGSPIMPPAVAPVGPPTLAPAAVAPRLIVSATHAEIPLPGRPELVVGREDPMSNSFPDVDLNPHGALELGVSRRHALITHSGDQYYLEDLNSVNGTLLNQRRLTPRVRQPLQAGDALMLGRLGLVFEQR